MKLFTNTTFAMSGKPAVILQLLAIALLGGLLPLDALAQVGGVTINTGGVNGSGAGADFWNSIKAMWFGYPGMIIGVVVLSLAVYYYFKDGMMAVLGVLGIGLLFFFIPGLVSWFQSLGRSM